MQGPYGFPLSPGCPSCKFRANGFFCQLSPAELNDFDLLKSVAAYPAGATLFVEQQKPRGVYVLCHGRVKLSLSSSKGKVLVLRIATAGEVLGLSSALSGDPYEVTAVALRPCQVAFVASADFQRFVRQHPDVLQPVTGQLRSEYMAACDLLRSVALGATVPDRLAHFLLAWSAREGASANAAYFTLPLNHEEIAEFVGTTRESVTRTLSEFRKHGVVGNRGSTFVIPDRAALEQLRFRDAGPREAGPRLVPLKRRLRHPIKVRRAVLKQASGR